MAQELETLVVQLSADIKKFENAMSRAQGITNQRARAIEKRFEQLNKSFAGIGASASNITAPLTGIVAAIGTREILAYADAWTSAKNSLAVAGVTGDNQVQILDKLYQSAQKNAVPIGAMTDLFGKAAQASDMLGASQGDLTKFADGVGVAIKVAGTNSTAASHGGVWCQNKQTKKVGAVSPRPSCRLSSSAITSMCNVQATWVT